MNITEIEEEPVEPATDFELLELSKRCSRGTVYVRLCTTSKGKIGFPTNKGGQRLVDIVPSFLLNGKELTAVVLAIKSDPRFAKLAKSPSQDCIALVLNDHDSDEDCVTRVRGLLVDVVAVINKLDTAYMEWLSAHTNDPFRKGPTEDDRFFTSRYSTELRRHNVHL